MAERTNAHQVLGCDVGQGCVVIFDSLSGTTRSVNNTPKALRRVLAELSGKAASTLVVCEATGGHETSLLSLAGQASLAAHRADPRKASAFCRSLRSHGKTDAIDAQALARYGLERGDSLPLWRPPSRTQEELRSLVRLRADLVRDRADYVRRRKAPGSGPDKAHIRATIEALTTRIENLEADIDRRVDQDAELAAMLKVIVAIPGCGRRTAITLIALMPELGSISRRQIAALSGLAPHPNDSAKTSGYRRVRGGRTEVREALFIAALVAARYHPQLRDHFQHLLAKGKKRIVATIAIARKLITIINAKIRDALSPEIQLC